MPSKPYNARLLAGDTYVVPGLTNSGFIAGLAIDTCEDEAPYAGVPIDLLAITHGHPDHFSAAAAIRAAGAKVAAPRDDASLVENPDINIRGMFSWAKPGDVFITKLFKGTPVTVDSYFEDWADDRARVIPLQGHTLGHHGLLTADKVLFTGDALYQSQLWQRHPLPYAIDPGEARHSLERITDTDFDWLVPGHGTPTDRETALDDVEFHMSQLAEIEDLLLDYLQVEHTTEESIARVAMSRKLVCNPASYWLAVTTVKGFLGDLLDRNLIEFFVRDYTGWWRNVD